MVGYGLLDIIWYYHTFSYHFLTNNWFLQCLIISVLNKSMIKVISNFLLWLLFYSGKNSKNYLFKSLKHFFLGDNLQKTAMLQNQSAYIYMLNPFLAKNTPNFMKKNRKIDFWGWYQRISRQPPRWHVNWSKTTHHTCGCFTIANDSNWLFDLWNFGKNLTLSFFRNKTLLAIKGWKISSEQFTKKFQIHLQ